MLNNDQPRAGSGVRLTLWDPEDVELWSAQGSSIASRNLWISIPNLLCAFAVWLYWSIIIVQMQNLHATGYFPFAADKSLLYTLPAIAGLAGATLRIPNSFMINIAGGRNVIFVTSILLIAPALGVGLALQQAETSWLAFAVLACLSGVGGGAFASSMSNISFFYPKRVQGTSLGLNAGLGNVGVSVMQGLLPFVMTFGLFGALGGASQTLPEELGGARVTQWDTVVMIGAALGVGYFVVAARSAERPEAYWWPFLLLFLLLFITTGIGNGSTFRMIPIIFKPEQAGPVLGWTSAIAAYGAFLIPRILGTQIKAGHPEYALYGFAAYYLSCLAVNWWFYARRNAEIRC